MGRINEEKEVSKMENLKTWLKCAGTRCAKTMAQTAVALLTTGITGILEVDWIQVVSVSALAGLVSLLTSIAGLPEAKKE
jgi:hypothetical protein